MSAPTELISLRWERANLRLEAPMVTGAGRVTDRQVVLLEATLNVDGEEVVGVGEAAPLPGWSRETLDECVARLEQLSTLDRMPPLESLEDLPSLRFGLELSLLDAQAKRRSESLSRYLADTGIEPLRRVPVQHTIGARPADETRAHAVDAVKDGFDCLKLKVGAASLDEDVERVASVRHACPDATIRLDANGAWSLPDARRALEALDADVDFVEQPVAADDIDALAELASTSPIAVAADESCAPLERGRRLVDEALVPVVVLKPSMLGGIISTLRLIELAEARGVRVVLSSLIESAVGRAAIAHLAASRPDLDGPHGLATGAWLADDVTTAADRIERGQLHVPSGAGIGFTPELSEAGGAA